MQYQRANASAHGSVRVNFSRQKRCDWNIATDCSELTQFPLNFIGRQYIGLYILSTANAQDDRMKDEFMQTMRQNNPCEKQELKISTYTTNDIIQTWWAEFEPLISARGVASPRNPEIVHIWDWTTKWNTDGDNKASHKAERMKAVDTPSTPSVHTRPDTARDVPH